MAGTDCIIYGIDGEAEERTVRQIFIAAGNKRVGRRVGCRIVHIHIGPIKIVCCAPFGIDDISGFDGYDSLKCYIDRGREQKCFGKVLEIDANDFSYQEKFDEIDRFMT
jgi:hypothetical protein